MRFVVGYDGSEVSKDALKLAAEYASPHKAKLYVVTSMKGGPEITREEFEGVERELEELEIQMREKGFDCQSLLLVRGNEPGEDLVNFAVEKEASLIFVGIKHRSKVGKLIFGSTAQYTILKSPCPVMTVK